MTTTDKPISDDAFKGAFSNYSARLMRASALRERKACADLVRSVMAEQRLADLGELLAKNIEARP